MMIRLLKQYSSRLKGWEGDCDDTVARRLISEGTAEAIGPPVVERAIEEAAVETAALPVKKRGRPKRAVSQPQENHRADE